MLVTGATGFVGSHVVEAFAGGGWRVRALVRDEARAARLNEAGVELAIGSLEDAESLRSAVAGAGVVVHLAAATRAPSPEAFERVNAAGTRHVVDALLADPEARRLVYLSSLSAVGPAAGGRPVRAGDTPRPLGAYGRSKRQGEEIVLAAADRIDTVVLRAPAVYGPRDRDLFTFFRLAAMGILPLPTGPERRIQMVHVRDLAEAVVKAAESSATGIFHIAEPRDHAWGDVLALMSDAVGRKGRIVPLPGGMVRAAGAVSESWSRLRGAPGVFDRDKASELLADGWLCETDAARVELGFTARTSLAEGLRETAEWYRREGWL